MRTSEYTAALSSVRSGSFLDYWDTLSNLLKTRVQFMKPGKSRDSVILQQMLDLSTTDVGDAMTYYDRTTELKDELEEAMIDSQTSATLLLAILIRCLNDQIFINII